MSFSANWLAMREPYDLAARNGAVLNAVAAAIADAPAVTVTDLGCGTGATMRAVAPRLPAGQHWRLVDNDDALLTTALEGPADAVLAGVNVTAVTADLASAIEPVLGDCDLVTTSALLDLVSAAWLDRLVASLVRLSRPLYAALSYDGTVTLSPQSRLDAEVIAAVNRHQRTDKGFGPALGPDAARIASERLRVAGFTVIEGRSDWQFDPGDRAIQNAMIGGWAVAARETGVKPFVLLAWLAERTAYLQQGCSTMQVGHIDFFATPTGRR
jgi:SAM-dependent methyltransferase